MFCKLRFYKTIFHNLRKNLNALSAIFSDLLEEQFQTCSNDLQANEFHFKQRQEHAFRVKLQFDKL